MNLHRQLLALLALWVALVAPRGANADTPEPLVLELRLGGHVLDEGLAAFTDDGRLLLPVGAVARALDLAVEVTEGGAAAEGWVLHPDRRVRIDPARRVLTVSGRERSLDPDAFYREAGELYVPADVLEACLPVRFTLDERNLALVAAPSEPLPREQRLERERRWARLDSAHGSSSGAAGLSAEHEVLVPPHALATLPFVDVEASGVLGASGELAAGHRAVPQASRFSVRGSGDLLGLGAEWLVTGTEADPLRAARLRLSRKDPRGGLLGPLDLRDVSLGDVTSPSLPLLARPTTGLGVQLSSFPLTRAEAFDRTTLHGELPEGWEVELHRNGALLAYRRGDASGRYRFEDVPLLFGRNVLRLDFYGPHGERRHEDRLVLVGPGMIRPGEAHFRVTTLAEGRDLLPFDAIDGEAEAGALTGDVRAIGEAELGLGSAVTLGAAAGVAPTALAGDGAHDAWTSVGVRAVLPGAYGRLDVLGAAGEDSLGWGARAEVQTELAGVHLVADHSQLFGEFVTEAVPYRADPLRSRSRVRLDGRVPLPATARQAVPFALTATHDGFASGRQQSRAALRLATSFGRLTVSHEASASTRDFAAPTAGGMGTVRYRGEDVALGADLLYALGDEAGVHAWQARSEWRLPLDLLGRAGVRHQRYGGDAFTATAGLGRRHGALAWSLDAGWDTRDGAAVGLTVGASFGHDAASGESLVGSEHLAQAGAVSARIYHDRDADGRFSEGDVPIEGAWLELDGAAMKKRPTGPDGATLVGGLRAHDFTRVRVARGSLVDPFLRPSTPPRRILGRPGRVAHLDVPVTMMGEVEGRVLAQLAPGRERPVPNVPVALVDRSGRTVATTRTAFDGWYVFGDVAPGAYRVRVEEAEAAARSLAPGEAAVTLGGDGGLASAGTVALASLRPELETAEMSEPPPSVLRRRVRTPRRSVPSRPAAASAAVEPPEPTRTRIARLCAVASLCPGRPAPVGWAMPMVVPGLLVGPASPEAPAAPPAPPVRKKARPAGPDPRLYPSTLRVVEARP